MLDSALIETPLGRMRLVASESALLASDWVDAPTHQADIRRLAAEMASAVVERRSALTDLAARELAEYFAGLRHELTVPVMVTGTAFRINVLKAIATVGYGSAVTYSQLCDAAGCGRRSVRAVARACGSNLLSVVVPCHRIVGVGGPGGYRAGLAVKSALLELERQNVAEPGMRRQL